MQMLKTERCTIKKKDFLHNKVMCDYKRYVTKHNYLWDCCIANFWCYHFDIIFHEKCEAALRMHCPTIHSFYVMLYLDNSRFHIKSRPACASAHTSVIDSQTNSSHPVRRKSWSFLDSDNKSSCTDFGWIAQKSQKGIKAIHRYQVCQACILGSS